MAILVESELGTELRGCMGNPFNWIYFIFFSLRWAPPFRISNRQEYITFSAANTVSHLRRLLGCVGWGTVGVYTDLLNLLSVTFSWKCRIRMRSTTVYCGLASIRASLHRLGQHKFASLWTACNSHHIIKIQIVS